MDLRQLAARQVVRSETHGAGVPPRYDVPEACVAVLRRVRLPDRSVRLAQGLGTHHRETVCTDACSLRSGVRYVVFSNDSGAGAVSVGGLDGGSTRVFRQDGRTMLAPAASTDTVYAVASNPVAGRTTVAELREDQSLVVARLSGVTTNHAVTVDPSTLLLACSDSTLCLVDRRVALGTRVVRVMRGHRVPAERVAVDPVAGQALSTSLEASLANLSHGSVRLWDLGTGRGIYDRYEEESDSLSDVVSVGDQRHFVTTTVGTSSPYVLRVWDKQQSKPVFSLSSEHRLRAVCAADDGEHVACVCDDGMMYLWSARRQQSDASLCVARVHRAANISADDDDDDNDEAAQAGNDDVDCRVITARCVDPASQLYLTADLRGGLALHLRAWDSPYEEGEMQSTAML